jgi:hypothetical protein
MNFHGEGKQCGCNQIESAADPSRYNAKKRLLPSAAASIDSEEKHTGKNPEPWRRRPLRRLLQFQALSQPDLDGGLTTSDTRHYEVGAGGQMGLVEVGYAEDESSAGSDTNSQ